MKIYYNKRCNNYENNPVTLLIMQLTYNNSFNNPYISRASRRLSNS